MKLAVSGMTCQGCVNAVTRSIQRAAPGSAVTVDLPGGAVEIAGAVVEPAQEERVFGQSRALGRGRGLSGDHRVEPTQLEQIAVKE